MGWELKHKLPENQIPTGESIAETPQVLRQKQSSHPPVWWFTQWTQRLHHPRWPSHSFCEQVSHRHRDMICQHWEGTPSHHVWLWKVPHLPVRKNIYSWNWPQTAGDDKYEKSHFHPSQATENASLTAAVWHDHHIQTRQGNAPGWCPKLSPFKDWHTDPAQPQRWCHIHFSFHKEPPDQDCSRNTMRSHLVNSTQTDTEWLTRQMYKHPQNCQKLLGFLWWTLNQGWSTHERWMSHHPTILQRLYHGWSPQKPCRNQQGIGLG